MTFEPNQQWAYAAPVGFEASRIVIGAIARCDQNTRIICISILGAPRREPDGRVIATNIPFLPMTEAALHETITHRDGTAEPPSSFANALRTWSEDERGLSMFTVPFEGTLDRMIANQMAEIVKQTAA